MVMLQSPVKNTDNTSTAINASQMSPNSNPDSPKSNTSPDLNKSNASEINNANNTDINSPTGKIPKFIITPQNNPNIGNSNSNNNNNLLKSQEEGLRYSMERLKQMTESHQQCLTPDNEELDGGLEKNNRRSQTPPIGQHQQQQHASQTGKPLNPPTTVRQLARPEPLQHPHAALLQQHPHLLQNPQFLVAAAQAQHQHHQQQHHHHHPHVAFHGHLPTAAAAAAAFHLRAPTTGLTLPPVHNLHNTTPPSPANSPLSPPSSPRQQNPQQPQHSEQQHQPQQQQHLIAPNPSMQMSTNPLQPSSNVAGQHHTLNGQLASIPPPLSVTAAASQHLTLSPTSSSTSTTISSSPSLSSHQEGMDLEKLKLVAQAQAVVARSTAVASVPNARPDLSDYGFRIQLGGLAAAAAAAAATSRQIAAANYARSDTSEELNVDGNDEDSNDGSQGTPSVSVQILICCYLLINHNFFFLF